MRLLREAAKRLESYIERRHLVALDEALVDDLALLSVYVEIDPAGAGPRVHRLLADGSFIRALQPERFVSGAQRAREILRANAANASIGA